jgi:hypothetical protein
MSTDIRSFGLDEDIKAIKAWLTKFDVIPPSVTSSILF